MSRYFTYAKRVKRQMIVLVLSFFFCTSSSMMFFSDILGGWVRDQDIGILHTILSCLMGIVGVTGIIWCINSFWQQCSIKKTKKILGFCICGYIAVQLVMGIMVGIMGVFFEKIIGLSYVINKEVLFYTANIIQSIMLSIFIFVIVCAGYLKEVNKLVIRKHQDKIIKGIGMGVSICAVTSVVSTLSEGVTSIIMKAILESLGIIVICIYYGTCLEGDR